MVLVAARPRAAAGSHATGARVVGGGGRRAVGGVGVKIMIAGASGTVYDRYDHGAY